jgi:hypothetical protein
MNLLNGARLNPPIEQCERPFQRRCNHLALEKFGLVVADNVSLLLDTDFHLGGEGEGGGEEEERKEQDQDLYFHLKRTTWFRVTSLHTDFSWLSQLCERPFQRRC